MSEPRACPQCGSTLPADAPDGLCPKCLLHLGFESQSRPAKDDPAYSPTVYQPSALPPSVEELAVKFPHLEILEPIGQGGMGVVYKARQKDLDRIVALKILRPDFERDPAFAERFVREARALARLSHPAIVTVYDFGRVDGFYYFLMEYIDGTNLRELERSGQLQPQQALAIVPQICEALQSAHDQGVVHRDIKPENILIDKQGRVKIADFGLAKMVGAVPEAATLTGAWQVMGTPHYMAPEQMQGSHSVDHRADIYSLGVVIYEMLTGELPVGRFPLPSQRVQVDVRLDEVVLKTLEREPERRYQKASEVKSDLETITGVSTPAAQRMFGREYRSQTTLLGVPLVHIAFGLDPLTGRPRTARGIIAIGDRAVGGLAIGGGAVGGIALGGLALGMVSLGGLSLGLLAAVGGMAIGGFAFGGGALGVVAIGGGAAGYYAFGGQAWGQHVLSSQVRDPAALEFFRGWAENWTFWLTTLGIGMPVAGGLLALLIWLVFSLQGRRARRSSSAPGAKGGEGSSGDESAVASAEDGVQQLHSLSDALCLLISVFTVTGVGVFGWLALSPTAELVSRNVRISLMGIASMYLVCAILIGSAAGWLRYGRWRLPGLIVLVVVGIFLPAVNALNVIREFRNIPVWPVLIPLWLGVPVCLWGVRVLYRRDVRAVFEVARTSPGVQANGLDLRAPARALVAVGIFEWIACWVTVILLGLVDRDAAAAWVGGEEVLGRMVVAVALLGAALSAVVILAGLKLSRRESRGLCLTGSVTAMLVSPGNVLGLPIGLWALYILTRPEVQRAFHENERTPVRTPQERVRWPAIGLIVYGGLTLLLEGMYVLGTLVQWEEEGLEAVRASLQELGPLLLAGMVVGVPVAILAIIAGRRLLRLQSQRWVVVASVLAMLPWGLTFPLGLPVGLWALWVLTRREVQGAFQPHGVAHPAAPRGETASSP